MNNEIVLFHDGDVQIEAQVSPDQETVWLSQKQMSELFGVKQATLSEHITNILESGELDETSIGFSDKSSGGRKPKLYRICVEIQKEGLLSTKMSGDRKDPFRSVRMEERDSGRGLRPYMKNHQLD